MSSWLFPRPHEDPDVRRVGTTVHWVAVASLVLVAVGLALGPWVDVAPALAAVQVGTALVCVVVILVARRGRVRSAGWLYLAAMWSLGSAGTMAQGGIHVGPALLYLFLVVYAGLLLSPRAGFVTAGVTAAYTAVLTVLIEQGALPSTVVEEPRRLFMDILSSGLFTATFVALAWREAQAANARVRELATRLQQAERLEAIGRLAGGIAHDFNNLLTVVGGNANLLELGELTESQRELTGQIRGSTRRGANLVRQLMAFGRRQAMSPTVEDLAARLRRMRTLLVSVLGERIELKLHLPREPLYVNIDAGQFERVVMNLITNARDAMARGGELAVTGSLVRVEAGQAVRLDFADNGTGMDPATRQRAFEPFFTTKEAPHGTGLGLSSVFGIVSQSGGTVQLLSPDGGGTTVRIELPSVAAPAVGEDEVREAAPAQRRVTILLVEDDELVRRVVAMSLRRAGHEVIVCDGAESALAAAETRLEDLDLIVSDVVMPRVSGPELVARLRKRRPELPALLMSGHAPEAIAREIPADVHLLHKPFDASQLADRVATVLASLDRD